MAVDFSESSLQNPVAIPVRGPTELPARSSPLIPEAGRTRSSDFLLKHKAKQLKSLSRKRCDQVCNIKLTVVGRTSKDWLAGQAWGSRDEKSIAQSSWGRGRQKHKLTLALYTREVTEC